MQEEQIFKKIGLMWVVALFTVGLVIGGLGGALLVTDKTVRFEADVMTRAIADSSFSLVPMLISLNEDELEKQINLIASSTRTQLTAGILIMHANMPLLSNDGKEFIEGILRSIASKRPELKIGRFANPPRKDIEEILVAYVE